MQSSLNTFRALKIKNRVVNQHCQGSRSHWRVRSILHGMFSAVFLAKEVGCCILHRLVFLCCLNLQPQYTELQQSNLTNSRITLPRSHLRGRLSLLENQRVKEFISQHGCCLGIQVDPIATYYFNKKRVGALKGAGGQCLASSLNVLLFLPAPFLSCLDSV